LVIRHEETKTMILIIDRIIEDLGYRDILGPQVGEQMDAYKTLRQNGIPHNRGQGDRWYTIPKGHRDLNAILENEVPGEDLRAVENLIPGAWEVFMTQHHDALSSLGDYRKYLTRVGAKEISPRQQVLVGINPRTGYPRKNRDYEVDLASAIIVPVPDRYLESPPVDPIRKRPLFVVPITEEFNQASFFSGKDIVLRAAATGKMWHLPFARIVEMPQLGGAYGDFFRTVAARYAESGKTYTPSAAAVALIGNGPYPLFDLMGPEEGCQSLKLPKHIFEGILAPKLASYRKKPQGIILRDDALRIDSGPICLVEAEGANSTPTGWRVETHVSRVSEVGFAEVESLPEKDLAVFGFACREEALDHIASLFSTQQMDPRDPQNKALAIVFNRVDDHRRGIFYYNSAQEVVSCLKLDCLSLADRLTSTSQNRKQEP
jgi:hypothetical protein